MQHVGPNGHPPAGEAGRRRGWHDGGETSSGGESDEGGSGNAHRLYQVGVRLSEGVGAPRDEVEAVRCVRAPQYTRILLTILDSWSFWGLGVFRVDVSQFSHLLGFLCNTYWHASVILTENQRFEGPEPDSGWSRRAPS